MLIDGIPLQIPHGISEINPKQLTLLRHTLNSRNMILPLQESNFFCSSANTVTQFAPLGSAAFYAAMENYHNSQTNCT